MALFILIDYTNKMKKSFLNLITFFFVFSISHSSFSKDNHLLSLGYIIGKKHSDKGYPNGLSLSFDSELVSKNNFLLKRKIGVKLYNIQDYNTDSSDSELISELNATYTDFENIFPYFGVFAGFGVYKETLTDQDKTTSDTDEGSVLFGYTLGSSFKTQYEKIEPYVQFESNYNSVQSWTNAVSIGVSYKL